MLPLIVGCRSTRLSTSERICFEELSPSGFILFAHNIDEPSQVRDLCTALHEAASARSRRNRTAILIDQEGGCVQRLRPPRWRGFPCARAFGDYWQRHGREDAVAACRASAWLMGLELADLGITVDCAPVCDLPTKEADSVIGDRAFASKLEDGQTRIPILARAQAEGLLDAGVLPVVKHVPGHGRATCDSHKALPRVEATRRELSDSDFTCFRALRDLPMMMTAHILYSDIDSGLPATLSKKTIENVVRSEIGFRGLLLSDDLRMKALCGSEGELACKALEAGCDLPLYCGSSISTIRAVAQAIEASFAAKNFDNLSAKLDAALALAARRKKTSGQEEKEEAERLLAQVEANNRP